MLLHIKTAVGIALVLQANVDARSCYEHIKEDAANQGYSGNDAFLTTFAGLYCSQDGDQPRSIVIDGYIPNDVSIPNDVKQFTWHEEDRDRKSRFCIVPDNEKSWSHGIATCNELRSSIRPIDDSGPHVLTAPVLTLENRFSEYSEECEKFLTFEGTQFRWTPNETCSEILQNDTATPVYTK